MALTNTEYGKAYEYACLKSLYDNLSEENRTIIDSDSYQTAHNSFLKAEKEGKSENLMKAANAATRVILRLEPELKYGSGKLTLIIQTDANGIAGDVRDVVCVRSTSGWSIGLSCKHNHHAVKHSRLSSTIDFGKEWFGIPCSQEYFREVRPIFEELRNKRNTAIIEGKDLPLWEDVPNKAEKYYIPVLKAFLKELEKLSNQYSDIPGKLINYMLGKYDFYKVITDDRHQVTRVEAVNIAGTLNKSVDGHHSIVDVPKLKLPSRFYYMGLMPNSNNKIEIVCDEGWTLTMRIHNASSKIEPSLKFDVQLISLPSSIHAQVEPW